MFRKIVASFVCLAFLATTYQPVAASEFSINRLPTPGTMVGLSSPFAPLALKGLVVNLQKPLEFQFIVDTGRGPQNTTAIKEEANRLVKYFLAGLTIPEGDLWVNLSPYEKDRMVPEALGQTDLGRDLLAQDYILKQLTASLIYPEKDLGKEFWAKVYKKAQEQFGTTNIPVNTFNKVWVLPDQAQVFENKNAAYVTKSTLKVMLDEDYLALNKNTIPSPSVGRVREGGNVNTLGSQIVREIILPEIEKEVNTGTNFAPLRQIYQALILAKWYKETVKNALLEAVYLNQKKTAGVNLDDPAVKEQIYNRYLQAYKKGVFNYIKEDSTPDGQAVPRKYFSGGITKLEPDKIDRNGRQADVKGDGAMMALKVDLEKPKDAAMTANRPDAVKSLNAFAGIPVSLNGATGELILGQGLVSEPLWERPLKDAGNSIANPRLIAENPDRVVYYGYRNVRRAGDTEQVDKIKLRFDITVLKPGFIGDEYIMTKGHEHPGTNYSEFYEVWNGTALYVQQGVNPETGRFEMLATLARPGDKVLMLTGYSHRTVNIGSEPLVMANWISDEVGGKESKVQANVKPDFSEIEKKNGYTYHVVMDRFGDPSFRHNPAYGPAPADLRLAVPAASLDENGLKLSKDRPMYGVLKNPSEAEDLSVFLRNPQGFKLFQNAFKIIDQRQFESGLSYAAMNVDEIKTRLDNGKDSVRQATMDDIDKTVTDPEKKLLIFGKFLNHFNSDVRLWAMNGIDRLVIAPEKKLPLLKKALEIVGEYSSGHYFDRSYVRHWAMREIDRIVTDPEKKLPILKEALKSDYSEVGSWVMEEIDRIVTDPEKKLPILQKALRRFYDSGAPFRLWAMSEIDRIVTDPKKKLLILQEALGPHNSSDVFLWARRETDRLVTDPEKKLPNPNDSAMLGQKPTVLKSQDLGGIDLNQINVNREGKAVVVQFDPAQLNQLMQGGFEGFTPVIINITPIQSPLPLLGVNPRKEEALEVAAAAS